VAAAIRRGVQAAERATGRPKPVLLCLMGAAGTVTLVEEIEGRPDGRVFPAFRFPESAPRALGRVARYAAYRRRAPGQLVWYDDADGAAGRALVRELLADRTGDEPVPVPGETAVRLLGLFGLAAAETADGTAEVRVAIRHDPLFGPLIEIERPGGRRAVRITPLTDRDVAELLEGLGLAGEDGLAEVLGRLSQMIEELPWLWSLEARAPLGNGPAVREPVSMTLRPAGGAGRAPI